MSQTSKKHKEPGLGSLGTHSRGGAMAPLVLAALLVWPVAIPAGMVDTVQYGHIQLGMKEKEVIERLGPPDRIQEKQKAWARNKSSHGRGQMVRTKRLIYTGSNPASGQKITTIIVLENGKVVDKRRSYD